MSSSLPFISVVIPTYNRGLRLATILASIVNQTYSDWECVVVEDGSTDDSAQVVEEFRRQHGRFIYHTQDNKGAGIARNVGASLASGKYLFFLDADDEILPDGLSILAQAIASHPDVGAISGVKGGPEHTQSMVPELDLTGSMELRDTFLLTVTNGMVGSGYSLGIGSSLIRRDVFAEIGGFVGKVLCPTSEDWQFFIRLTALHPVLCVRAIIGRTVDRDQGKHHAGLVSGVLTKTLRRIVGALPDDPAVQERLRRHPGDSAVLTKWLTIYDAVLQCSELVRAGKIGDAAGILNAAVASVDSNQEIHGIGLNLKYYLYFQRSAPQLAAQRAAGYLMKLSECSTNARLAVQLRTQASDCCFFAAQELLKGRQLRAVVSLLVWTVWSIPTLRTLKSLVRFCLGLLRSLSSR